MPGKQFLYNRVIISSASRQQQQTINTYLSNIDVTIVEPVYYCLSEIAEEVSIAGNSLNQE